MTAGGGSPHEAGGWDGGSPGVGPLQGLRVIDAGTMIAGPFAATLLADYGADVVKIEKPGAGDPMRQWPPMKEDKSLWWKATGRNKRLITLNMATGRGRDLFLRLVEQADVVVENFRPGTLEKWGLSYEVLRRHNRGVILLRVSGYGQTGPYRDRPGYGTVADAFSGIPSFTGFPDRPPTLPGFPLADTLAASFGVIGVLAALRARERDGVGDVIDVSLFEPLFRLAENQVIAYDQLGIVKQRVGNRLEEDSPRNTYATLDGKWVAISASSDRTFQRLAAAVDEASLADDPRFATNAARIANADELDGILAFWFAARSAADAMETLERLDVVGGLVYTIEDIFQDAHYAARNCIVAVSDEDFGVVKMPNVVPRFGRFACSVHRAGGAAGQDNDAVYRDVLRLDAAECDELRSQGVI